MRAVIDRRSGTSLYRSTPILSKFKQLNWAELTLPIIPGAPKKVHKFEIKSLCSENRSISKAGVTC